MQYIKRELAKELRRAAKEYPVVALLGPRQSGKTTLAQKVFHKKKYVSLENLDDREFAINDPKHFLDHYENAIIDEAQHAPDLFSYIQTKVDQDKIKGQFILAGSNQSSLSEKITQSLAGRVVIIRLLPLSIGELKSHRKKIVAVDEIIFQGFYPPLHAEKKEKQQWLDNYIETYIGKDVRLIKNVGNLSRFQVFLKMCAARVGQLINLHSLANDFGVAQNTIKSWLSILESGFIIRILEPYYKKFNKRLIKTPKIYFYDTGVLCRLLSIRSHDDLATHALRGSIFENLILIEIEKYFFNRVEKVPVYFWRNREGQEIDFLLEDSGLKLIEVKAGQTINDDYFKGIKYFKTHIDAQAKAYLVYTGERSQMRAAADVLSWHKLNKIFT